MRVPQGKSIHFDKATQSFQIPPNTRFYKTFLKKIIDTDGHERFRKIETRIIVARPDIEHADGTTEVDALFGTYAWNDNETAAQLVTDPLLNSEPFRDRLITYITDEPKAQAIRDKKPRNLTYALEDAKVVRRYAIPGSERCIQCHMGSPSKSFVLGFLPMQIRRRPVGEGGVIEPSGPDELTQLERLIDYGIITGINSPSDSYRSKSRKEIGSRATNIELKAQGYLLGNCAALPQPARLSFGEKSGPRRRAELSTQRKRGRLPVSVG